MKEKLEQIDDFRWRIPKEAREGMRVGAVTYAKKELLDLAEDAAVEQLTNVACLPGIVEPVLGMPDMHWGYGLPMGAVGAFDSEEGVISAGCTGFDINCGIHMLKCDLAEKDIRPKLKELMDLLFQNVPCGVGSKSNMRLSEAELDEVLTMGAEWAVEKGYGIEDDLKRMEENGNMAGADPSKVSPDAKKRGRPQVGTLGAGNHFLEVQASLSKWHVAKSKPIFIRPHGLILQVHAVSPRGKCLDRFDRIFQQGNTIARIHARSHVRTTYVLQQCHALYQCRFKRNFAVHCACRNSRYFSLDSGLGGQFINALLLDHG